MVHDIFINYFIATASAGAALIGLLFVSVSIAPHRTVQASAPIEARVMSSSAFTALLNGFFISLAAIMPHWNIGWVVLIVSLMGITNTLSQSWLMLRPWPTWQNVIRRVWLNAVSLGLYLYELVTALQIIFSPTSDVLIFNLGTLLMYIYAIALLRAWELLGVQRSGLMSWLNPLYDINASELKKKKAQ